MRNADASTVAYLNAREGTIARDLLWIEGKNRSTGGVETAGFWNDIDTVTIEVISGATGLPVTRNYTGSGSLISVDPIPLVSDLTVRTIRLRLSQVNEAVLLAIRGYDPRLAHVELHRVLLDIDTHAPVAPALPHFVGQVNLAPINTPPVGSEGSIELSIVSHSRELTRINPAKRSDETQKLRSGDRFRRHTSTAGEIEYWWGERRQRAGGPNR